MSLASKVGRFFQVIKHNGGIKGSILKLARIDILKIGTLVGTDELGNRYYENNYYQHGQNRWVEYSDKAGYDYDGSQISAEWHGWMHYNTDIPPTKANYPKHKWMIPYTENLSGTPKEYVPYSTTPKKIHSWVPKK